MEAYSSMGLVMGLYVASIISFCFPHVVDVSALSICIVFVVLFRLCLYVSFGSRVNQSIFGFMFMGSMVLSICRSRCVIYLTGFGLKRVHVVLFALRMRLFVCVHVCISCRNNCLTAMFLPMCVDVMVMSSQGSVLSPILFNIYTNDQPIHDGTHNFIYVDDLCVTDRYSSFTDVKTTIGDALEELTQYYRSNSLCANPDKTQVTAFHLRNKEANRSLKVEWNSTKLENTPHPKYLGVTLDRTLSYMEHMHNTKMKVATRNNQADATYADDITITAPHTDITIAKANIQPYLQDVLKWTKTTTYFSTQTRRHAHYSPQTQQNTTNN